MVDRLGIAKTPDARTSVVAQPSSSGAGALADTMDALGREALQLNQRLQPLANDNAAKQAGKQAAAGNYNPKQMLVEEDRAYNNSIESAYMARMSTDVEETIATLVRDHPIDQPIESLKANIDAAKKAYIKQAPSAYAMQTGEAWDKVGSRGVISMADAQKKYTINKNFDDLTTRFDVIANKLSNVDDFEADDVKGLYADAEALAAQMMNPMYGQSSEKIQAKLDQIKDRIIFRGATNQALNIYETEGFEASRAYLEEQRKRTDLGLPDSQRDAIFSEVWSEVRFRDTQRKLEIAEAKKAAIAAQAQYKQELGGRMQDAILASERGIIFDGAPSYDEIEKAFGPAKAALYEQAMGGAPLMAELKVATAPQLNAILNEPPPEPSRPGYKQEIKMYDQRKRAAARLLKERQDDPMRAHIESGLVDPGDVQGALKDPGSFGIFMRTRGLAALQASQDYGTRPVPLTKQETQVLATYLDALDGKSRTAFMKRAADALGKDGAPAYRQLVAGLKPTSAPFTQAGMLLSLDNAKVGNIDATKASEIIMYGDALLNPNKAEKEASGKGGFAMPKDEELGRVWDKEVGKAYAGLGRAAPLAFQTYRAAYAGLASDAGLVSGDFDRDIAKQAAKIASGGVAKWNEKDVLLPWGMSEPEFQNRIARGWPKIVETHPSLKGTSASDWDLVALGQGRYNLARGNDLALGKTGYPVVVVLRK